MAELTPIETMQRIGLMPSRSAIHLLSLVALLIVSDLGLDLKYVFKPAETDISDV
jgi:hypothetical protein